MNDPPSPAAGAQLEEARQLLADGDADLYSRWFHAATDEVVEWPSAARYVAAVLDPTHLETGWRVFEAMSVPCGAVAVERQDQRRVVVPPSVVPATMHELGLDVGDDVLVDPMASGEVAGFWHMWSSNWQQVAPSELDRVYCVLRPEYAVEAVLRLVSLAPHDRTWSAKALVGKQQFGRRDGLVLYTPHGAELRSGWVNELIRALTSWCREDLPPFVTKLAAGIGTAPDPGDGRSFGQALADAVASAGPYAHDPAAFSDAAWQAIRALPGLSGTMR